MKNAEIAAMFATMADVLEMKGESSFRVNAYRRAARAIESLAEDVEELAERGALEKISGVGKNTAEKIHEYLATGRMQKYEEVMKDVPASLLELFSIPGLGPKTIALLNRECGVKSIADLKKVIEGGGLEKLPGMGKKKIENILRGIELSERGQERQLLGEVIPIVESIITDLEARTGLSGYTPAGSFRRRRETIGDIDILVAAEDGATIVKAFVEGDYVSEVLAAGDTKGSVVLADGLQVDLRVVPFESIGAALQYFTGSKDHNVKLRDIAKRAGLKINEYGVFRGDERIAGEEEKDVYGVLGLPWIPPELREDRGEIEAAAEGRLPELVRLEDIRGDLHAHSEWSDGAATIEEIVLAARARGYEYIAITDHTKALKIFGGLDEKGFREQLKEIQKVRERHPDITILAGAEVDIKADGSLDLADDMLEELDLVVASVHSGFSQRKEEMTKRVIRAIRHPCVNIIGHPTGRVLNRRDPLNLDMEAIFEEAAKYNVAMEINAYYQRLDLNDVLSRHARDFGVKLAIGTDAHALEHLDMMCLGVDVARRGWLEKKDVLNCMPAADLRRFLKKHRT